MELTPLFLETLTELERYVAAGDDYSMLRASALLRQLLLDGANSLAHLVAFNQRVSVGGQALSAGQLKSIILIVLDALTPLRQAINADSKYDPLLWREHALELKMAADALLPHYFEALREPPSSPGTQRRRFAFCHGFLLLMGFAIENALKGLRIADVSVSKLLSRLEAAIGIEPMNKGFAEINIRMSTVARREDRHGIYYVLKGGCQDAGISD